MILEFHHLHRLYIANSKIDYQVYQIQRSSIHFSVHRLRLPHSTQRKPLAYQDRSRREGIGIAC
jgi:hypothetical protein